MLCVVHIKTAIFCIYLQFCWLLSCFLSLAVERLDGTIESLEGMVSKLIKLARKLRRRKKTGNADNPSEADVAVSATIVEDSGFDIEEDGVIEQGVPTEEEGRSKGSVFPGTIIKSWWKSRYPYEGAAGFGLMREEMLVKSNAQQVL